MDSLFAHFDKKGLGKITMSEFKAGLDQKISLEGKLRFYLNDFMTPLQSLMKRQHLNPADIFDLFVTKENLTVAKLTPTLLNIFKTELKLELS